MPAFFLCRQVAIALPKLDVRWRTRVQNFETSVNALVQQMQNDQLDGAIALHAIAQELGKLAVNADTIRFFWVKRPKGHHIALPVVRFTNYENSREVTRCMSKIGREVARNVDDIKKKLPFDVHVLLDGAVDAHDYAYVAAIAAPNRQYLDLRSLEALGKAVLGEEVITITPKQLLSFFEGDHFSDLMLDMFSSYYGERFTQGGAQIIPVFNGSEPLGYFELTSPFTGLPAALPKVVARSVGHILHQALVPVSDRLLDRIPTDPTLDRTQFSGPLPIEAIDPKPQSWSFTSEKWTVVKANVNQIPPRILEALRSTAREVHSTFFAGYDSRYDQQFDPQATYIFVLAGEQPVACLRIIHRKNDVEGCVPLPTEQAQTFKPSSQETFQRTLESDHPAELSTFFIIDHDPAVERMLRWAFHKYLRECGPKKLYLLVDPQYPYVLMKMGSNVERSEYEQRCFFQGYSRRKHPGSTLIEENPALWEVHRYKIPSRANDDGMPVRVVTPAFKLNGSK